MFGVFAVDAQAADWRCGRDLISARESPQHSDVVPSGWQALSGLDIHAIDEFADPAFPDIKMRLANVAFVPEYAEVALQWMKAASQVRLEWRKLSDQPDYLGRYIVDIRGQDVVVASGKAPASWAEALLSQGLAMVLLQSEQGVVPLINAENRAITKRAGMWADTAVHQAYLVSALPHGSKGEEGSIPSVHDAIGRFVVVEGRLLTVEHQEWRSYLNFGSQWHRDFTIALDDELRGSFGGGQIAENALNDWIGRNIRVRGLVQNRGGPYIDLDDRGWLCLQVE